MMNFLPLIISLLTHFTPEKKREDVYKKLILNIMGCVFLAAGGVLGFVALSKYLSHHWGKMEALVIMCVLFLIISFISFWVGLTLKSRKSTAPDHFTNFVQAISHPSHQKFMKNLSSNITPKVIVGVLASVFVVSYFIHHETKKD